MVMARMPLASLAEQEMVKGKETEVPFVGVKLVIVGGVESEPGKQARAFHRMLTPVAQPTPSSVPLTVPRHSSGRRMQPLTISPQTQTMSPKVGRLEVKAFQRQGKIGGGSGRVDLDA